MNNQANGIIHKIAKLSLFGYFLSTTFSHALTQNFLGLALICGLIIIFAEKKYGRPFKLQLFPILILLYIGWAVLSSFFSDNALKSVLQLRENWLFLIIPAIAYFLGDKKSIKTAITLFAISVMVLSLYAIWQHFYGIDLYRGVVLDKAPEFGYRVLGTFHSRMPFADYFLITSVLFLWLIPYTKSIKHKTLFLTAFSVSSLAMAFTYCRAPLILLVITTIVFLIVYRKKYFKPAILIFLIMAAVIYVSSPDIFSRHIKLFEMEYKGEHGRSRLSIWRTAGNMSLDNPIFGVGGSNFKNLYTEYRDEKSIRVFYNAHNDLLDTAARHGIPAVLFYIGFWGLLIREILKFIREKSADRFLTGVATGILMATVVFFLTSIYAISFSQEPVKMFIFALWGLFFAVKSQVKAGNQTAEIIEKA